MIKAYIAGPDVFRPDALRWAEQTRQQCLAAGIAPLIPLDGNATSAATIYASNVAMIQAADVVLANLNSFRGAEPDSGTAFEVGYAAALGKPVIGYLDDLATTPQRVARWQGSDLREHNGAKFDANGWLVEDFALPLNLMLAIPAHIIAGDLAAALQCLVADGLAPN